MPEMAWHVVHLCAIGEYYRVHIMPEIACLSAPLYPIGEQSALYYSRNITCVPYREQSAHYAKTGIIGAKTVHYGFSKICQKSVYCGFLNIIPIMDLVL